MKADDKSIKKITLTDGINAPTRLEFEGLVATPLGREDVDMDLEAVNSSIEIIQRLRGGSWPSGRITRDVNLLDLAAHEREFREASSFAYAVRNTDGGYVGCFYLYGMGYRTALSDELAEYDLDASWWVSSEAYGRGEYDALYVALKSWLKNDFKIENPYFSNTIIPSEDNKI